MKKTFLCLLLAAAILAAGGCAFMSDEDRDFYGKGWIKPSDLDKTPPHHAIPDPSHPEQVAAAPARTQSADADPQWLIPEQAPQ